MNAFIPLAAFPAKEAPNWRIGAKLYLGFAVLSVFIFVGIWAAFRWEERRGQGGKTREREFGDEGVVGSEEGGGRGGKAFSVFHDKS